MNIKIKQPIDKHLIEAAEVLIKEFKTPANLLDFITNGLTWIDNYNNPSTKEKHEYEDTFYLTLIIKEVVQPWFIGKDIINKISEGLVSVCDMDGYEGLQDSLRVTMQAFAVDLKRGTPTAGIMDECLTWFNSMYKVVLCLKAWELDIERQSKHSEAA